jgi:hypothetical protein
MDAAKSKPVVEKDFMRPKFDKTQSVNRLPIAWLRRLERIFIAPVRPEQFFEAKE